MVSPRKADVVGSERPLQRCHANQSFRLGDEDGRQLSGTLIQPGYDRECSLVMFRCVFFSPVMASFR